MIILITGGAACGKSFVAEQLISRFQGKRYYIATMRPWGKDGQQKVAKHRAMRAGKHFETIECYGGLAAVELAEKSSVVLLECITNLVADELYDEAGNERSIDQVFFAVMTGIDNIKSQCDDLIMITNDVGSDGIRYDASTKAYIELLGKINCLVAQEADVVVDMCAGLPVCIKGSLEGEGSMAL